MIVVTTVGVTKEETNNGGQEEDRGRRSDRRTGRRPGARHLADANGGFACRAITRDPSKDPAKTLAGKGAQVVKADFDDLDSLKQAFAGAHAVF